jgi:hypothetical protein
MKLTPSEASRSQAQPLRKLVSRKPEIKAVQLLLKASVVWRLRLRCDQNYERRHPSLNGL